MPTDIDLTALLEALEAWESRLTQPQSAAVAALNAMPAVRKLLRGEIKLPLECERPEPCPDADCPVAYTAHARPCGACLPDKINAIVRKP